VVEALGSGDGDTDGDGDTGGDGLGVAPPVGGGVLVPVPDALGAGVPVEPWPDPRECGTLPVGGAGAAGV